MLNLNMDCSESIINKYSIGGHYSLHHDYLKIASYSPLGDRISSLLIYLNDVEQGGATIFPLINITIWPKKGSALFWYNLYSSGEYDDRTLHGGCPVLVGDKLIYTIWNLELLQDIHRPCVNSSRLKY